jgi:hypothetical protein
MQIKKRQKNLTSYEGNFRACHRKSIVAIFHLVKSSAPIPDSATMEIHLSLVKIVRHHLIASQSHSAGSPPHIKQKKYLFGGILYIHCLQCTNLVGGKIKQTFARQRSDKGFQSTILGLGQMSGLGQRL